VKGYDLAVDKPKNRPSRPS